LGKSIAKGNESFGGRTVRRKKNEESDRMVMCPKERQPQWRTVVLQGRQCE
jgi:hypothetical protein